MIAMKPPHKFFERHLNNNLDSLSSFLINIEEQMRNGQFADITQEDMEKANKTGCFATALAHRYNVFQFYHSGIHNLYNAVREMTIEACDYYGIDFKAQRYYIQGWFNLDGYETWTEGQEKYLTDLHDHGDGSGIPYFHGYYCVNAEPSITHYQINRETMFDNHNVNNRAILSEIGHPHRKGEWPRKDKRITIAYDMVTLESLDMDNINQHWMPLV